MLDLDANPGLRRLFLIARARVTAGFFVAAAAFWLARPTWGSLAAGTLVAAAGALLRIWAAGHLRKGEEVTRSGPYRRLRHPLYYGSFLIGLGFAIAAAEALAAGVVIAYLVVTLLAASRLEEATLREAFGAGFDDAGGAARQAERRFSARRMAANGEPRALAGFAAALGLLALKAWLLQA
ncbi:MAG: isoprenylcysteine carboxylmethyltransferase family protein [Acidobacteria bacterium]|nr:isoprenylcysteine carboxylmethyltransferase family protein [Acidobacteriota bacterium]